MFEGLVGTEVRNEHTGKLYFFEGVMTGLHGNEFYVLSNRSFLCPDMFLVPATASLEDLGYKSARGLPE